MEAARAEAAVYGVAPSSPRGSAPDLNVKLADSVRFAFHAQTTTPIGYTMICNIII